MFKYSKCSYLCWTSNRTTEKFSNIETLAAFIIFANNEECTVCLCYIDKFKETNGFWNLATQFFI